MPPLALSVHTRARPLGADAAAHTNHVRTWYYAEVVNLRCALGAEARDIALVSFDGAAVGLVGARHRRCDALQLALACDSCEGGRAGTYAYRGVGARARDIDEGGVLKGKRTGLDRRRRGTSVRRRARCTPYRACADAARRVLRRSPVIKLASWRAHRWAACGWCGHRSRPFRPTRGARPWRTYRHTDTELRAVRAPSHRPCPIHRNIFL
ncbi:hypothetical protein B0H15DRAFT_860495 [Mycena belliarum]|uniref:Uncharacterized protein n=1 Tax=Mycena belliarum TaxID=1033014 RepID=A0AAD6TST2_9AGAR|nr:hypothetical protein B0H15DRAFT_860495 [Mycena belliae]